MSQHKRNVDGMHRATRNKRDATVKHVLKILDDMLNNDHQISFSNIAKIARVSKAWLYRHTEIRQKIEKLRLQNDKCFLNQATNRTKNAIVAALKERVKKLETENCELRKQLEVVYGELHRGVKKTG